MHWYIFVICQTETCNTRIPVKYLGEGAKRPNPGEVTAFQLTCKTCGGRYHYFDYCLDTWPAIVPNFEDVI